MYQALYRKWRPQTFDEVVGQAHITDTLKNQIITGRLSHAYLFIGTRGTGKTTCARILARAVNCESPVNGNPCGKCAACRGISEGSVLDIVELDAASNNGVDNVRALREEAVFSPAAVKKRVYIIDEVHMLSSSAFNALLKILEEPPEHLMFILATTELHKVPATILSRCQRHSFKRIDAAVIARHIERVARAENMQLSRDAAELIARLAEGGVRDALSLLDQCSAAENIDVDAVYSAMGLAGNRRITELLELVLEHRADRALELFNGMWMDGKDPISVLNEMAALLRDSLVIKVAPKGGELLLNGSFDMGSLRDFARRMSREELLCGIDSIQRAVGSARDARNPKLTAELCLVSMCDSAAAESIGSLRARISRLEEQLSKGLPMRAEAPLPEEGAPVLRMEEELPREPVKQAAPRQPEAVQPPRQESTPPEDELDAEQFREEQPEEAMDSGRARPAAPEAAKARPWEEICSIAGPKLRADCRFRIADNVSVRPEFSGDELYLEAADEFIFNIFNKPSIMQTISDAARQVCGVKRVQLVKPTGRARPMRSLDELRGYKEVTFID